jgi:hypothetical protein
MKFTADTKTFREAFGRACSAVPTRTPKEVLKNFKVVAWASLRLIGSSEDVSIEVYGQFVQTDRSSPLSTLAIVSHRDFVAGFGVVVKQPFVERHRLLRIANSFVGILVYRNAF